MQTADQGRKACIVQGDLGSAVATNTRATEVRASLGTVQSLLGHSSSEVTRDVYLHSVPAGTQGAVQKVENLIGPKFRKARNLRQQQFKDSADLIGRGERI